MRSVKMLTDIRDVSRAAGDRWYVTNGVTAVGPVNSELLARGIEAGKVPLESFIRHEAWTVWKPLTEMAVVISDSAGSRQDDAPPQRSSVPDPSPDSGDRITSPGPAESPHVSFDDITSPGRPSFSFDPDPAHDAAYTNLPVAELFAPSDDLIAPVSVEEITAPSVPPLFPSRPSDDEITAPGRSTRPHGSADREGPFSGCATLEGALRQLVSSAVEDIGAEAVLIHQLHGDSAFIVCAHGPRREDVLGTRTALQDPAMTAAASGACVVAEPSPGPAGKAIEERLSALGVEASSALMIPIRLSKPGSLFGVIELGRRQQFLPQEVAAIGELTSALSARIEDAGWA